MLQLQVRSLKFCVCSFSWHLSGYWWLNIDTALRERQLLLSHGRITHTHTHTHTQTDTHRRKEWVPFIKAFASGPMNVGKLSTKFKIRGGGIEIRFQSPSAVDRTSNTLRFTEKIVRILMLVSYPRSICVQKISGQIHPNLKYVTISGISCN